MRGQSTVSGSVTEHPSVPPALRPWNRTILAPFCQAPGGLTKARIDWPEIRMCKRGEVVVGIERTNHFRLSDGMVAPLLHVLSREPRSTSPTVCRDLRCESRPPDARIVVGRRPNSAA